MKKCLTIIYRYGIIVIVPLRNIESPKWRNWQTHLTQNQAWLPHVPVRVRLRTKIKFTLLNLVQKRFCFLSPYSLSASAFSSSIRMPLNISSCCGKLFFHVRTLPAQTLAALFHGQNYTCNHWHTYLSANRHQLYLLIISANFFLPLFWLIRIRLPYL